MRTNLAIAALIYPMVQAVFFGLGLLALLVGHAPSNLVWAMIAVSFVISVPIALGIAPRLRSRAWRRRHGGGIMPS